MAQHIGIEKIDEKGQEMDEYCNINFADIINALYKLNNWEKEFPWLATIDPYSNTIFNRLQRPIVVEELKKLSQMLTDSEIKESIKNIISFFESGDTLEYVRFTGD